MRKKIIILSSIILLIVGLSSINVDAWWIGGDGFESANTANELKKGGRYHNYKYVPEYYDKYNGSKPGEFYKEGSEEIEDYVSYEHICWKDYIKLPTKAYSMYYIGIASAPYQSSAIGALYTNLMDESKNYLDVTFAEITSNTYEETVCSATEFSVGGKINGGKFKPLPSEFSGSYKRSWSNTFKTSTSIQDKVEYKHAYKMYGDGYYYAQRRALYQMYIVLTFEIEYIDNYKYQKVWLWNDCIHSYSIKGYIYEGYEVVFNYYFDQGFSFSKYEIDEDNCPHFIYPDKSSILYKDNYLYF